MSVLTTILFAVLGLAGGIVLGFRSAARADAAARRLWWVGAAIALGACTAVAATALWLGQMWLAVLALGGATGAITGLKYGGSEFATLFRAPAAELPAASEPTAPEPPTRPAP